MSANIAIPASPTKVAGTSKKIPTAARRQIHPIIEIVNGTKQFGCCGHFHQILRKFSVNIYSGELYALLGPHGCGKSTVLNVILGCCPLDIGHVKVFGFKPGHPSSGIPGIRVGYTPQSSGLYSEFTINEVLRYYGALLKLKRDYVVQRMTFLSTLLALPDDKQFIKHCTEGNKRQISFAVALLHEPELLILDEPCAGIDPVLRRSMWEHMRQLAKENKTILVTTQSCEEAKLADKIGFMRHGYLLIDGNPRELLKTYDEKLLETLYRRVYSLNLTIVKRTSSLEENPIIKLEPLSVTTSEGFLYTGDGSSTETLRGKRKPSLPSNFKTPQVVHTNTKVNHRFCLDFKRLYVLIMGDFLLFVRRYFWILLYLLLPSLFLIVFCVTIGTTPNALPIAIVNYESTEEDCLTNHDRYISCQVLDLLDQHIITQVQFDNVDKAWAAAKNLEVSAVFVIHKEFSAVLNRALSQKVLGKHEARIDPVPMLLNLDVTSRITSNTIERTIKKAIERYLQEATKGTEVENTGSGYPLKVGAPIFGTESTTDTDYLAPGLAITFIYYSAAFVIAITLLNDRVNKLTQRKYLAGVHLGETVLSQMIVYGFISILQAVLLFVVLLILFHMPNNGSLLYVTLIVLVQIWCGISFGIFVAMISKSAVSGGLCVFCCVVATLILCGIQWPLDGLPDSIYMVIQFLPQTTAIEAVRTILQRGTGIEHQEVWIGIVIPLCWCCVFTLFYSLINKVV